MHSQRRLHYLAICRCRKDGTFMPSRGSGFSLRRCVGLQSPMLVLQHQTEEGRRLWIVDCNQRVNYALLADVVSFVVLAGASARWKVQSGRLLGSCKEGAG